MRTIEMSVFGYEELSDEAKETAFENWAEIREGCGYSWDGEISTIIKHIEKNTPIRVDDLEYGKHSYNYALNVTGYHGKDDDKYHVTGLRAAKIALAMYYDITHKNQFYVRCRSYEGTATFSYYSEEYLKQTEKSRRSVFYKQETCFTGYCESCTFSEALYESIRENINNNFTVLDHFKVAFDKLFASVVLDYAAIESEDYFIENESDQAEYTADGEIYTGE